jgi:hypothetical protein
LSYRQNGIPPSTKTLFRSMARHRQHCHQATSERQIAVAPLGLIAVQLPFQTEFFSRDD